MRERVCECDCKGEREGVRGRERGSVSVIARERERASERRGDIYIVSPQGGHLTWALSKCFKAVFKSSSARSNLLMAVFDRPIGVKGRGERVVG